MLRRRTASLPTMAVFTSATRTFFPPSFKVPNAKAVNPLDKLRPPAPPCASDARPFGSLNRSLRPMNYTNVNTTRSTDDAAATAQTSAPPTAPTTAAPSASVGSRLDLSKLLKKHHPLSGSSSSSSSPLSSFEGLHQSKVVEVASATGSASFSALEPRSVVGRDTVARAQQIIAEREQKLREAAAATAQQEARAVDDAEIRRSTTTVTSQTSSHHARTASPTTQEKPSAPAGGSVMHQQVYREHCTVGWSPEDFYRVVGDVSLYKDFLPWCNDSVVHTTRRVRVPPPSQQLGVNQEALAHLIGEDGLLEAIQMTATLKVGFSFFHEQYTSLVTLVPGSHITAVLYDGDEESVLRDTNAQEVAGSRQTVRTRDGGGSGGGVGLVSSFFRRAAHSANEVAKKSILRNLRCDWEFAPMADRPNEVEVVFSVSFEFKNPMHSKFIMTNVVSLMTRSFENRCEQLYGPPSALRQRLPALSEG